MLTLSIVSGIIAIYLSASLLWADHKDQKTQDHEEEDVDAVFPSGNIWQGN